MEDIILTRADQGAKRRYRRRLKARAGSIGRGGSVGQRSAGPRASNADALRKPSLGAASEAASEAACGIVEVTAIGSGTPESRRGRASGGVGRCGDEGGPSPGGELTASDTGASAEKRRRGGARRRSRGSRTAGDSDEEDLDRRDATPPVPLERRLLHTLVALTPAQSALVADQLVVLSGLRVEAAALLGLDYEAKTLFFDPPGLDACGPDEGGNPAAVTDGGAGSARPGGDGHPEVEEYGEEEDCEALDEEDITAAR